VSVVVVVTAWLLFLKWFIDRCSSLHPRLHWSPHLPYLLFEVVTAVWSLESSGM
jgi:hypothetical protein